jgi:hypothetical protein
VCTIVLAGLAFFSRYRNISTAVVPDVREAAKAPHLRSRNMLWLDDADGLNRFENHKDDPGIFYLTYGRI